MSFRGGIEILDCSTFRHTKDAKDWAIAAMSGLCYQFTINMENALVHQKQFTTMHISKLQRICHMLGVTLSNSNTLVATLQNH